MSILYQVKKHEFCHGKVLGFVHPSTTQNKVGMVWPEKKVKHKTVTKIDTVMFQIY